MKRVVVLAFGALMLGLPALQPVAFAQSATEASPALAKTTFNVDNMTCALCPVTVKSAMSQVEGVQSVKIDFKARSATVVYDPALASPETIAAASANAGYPATARS
ncbi:MAG: heavy-metal-associated domain-containing protein [Rhodobacteraceae bacterium]|nr:heavy-metal-associated domain-containing protein [Paracoccaceae bacterium]